MTGEKVIELRFVVPQAEIKRIFDYNEMLAVRVNSIYLNMKEGKKLLDLLYKDQVNEIWNKFVDLPNETVIIFQNRQIQFAVPCVEEKKASTYQETLTRRTIFLEISEIEKLWNLFSKDRMVYPLLSHSIVIPNGTLMRVQSKQDLLTIKTLDRKIFNFFTSCFFCRK